MTWPLASLLLLALALAAGFAWYERSRPSAQVLALTATLAALAALGRVAFAPLPNVKPTTDIVLVAGAALGGAAGFATGAVAAAASNLFFGQGPWTPWQMAAWGLCGVLGAGLARAHRGGAPGRLELALACAAAGLIYGALVDLGSVLVAGGQELGRRYLANAAVSLPWNLVHAGGNAIFALAFGPALLRALRRFRARFEVRWRPLPGGAAPLAALALALLAVAAAGGAAAARAASPRAYLAGAQHRDGGWGPAPAQPTTGLYTAWAALGLAAYGVNPLDQVRGGRTPIDVLRRGAGSLRGAGDLERTLLVLGAAGLSPRRFAGRDLVAALARHRRRDGSFDGQVNLTAFAVLGLRAAGEARGAARVQAAARWLEREQEASGGWGFYRRGTGADIDDTGAVLQALGAAGRRHSAAAARGVRFLIRRQRPDGGFPAQPGGSANAQSTAWAVQGLVAVGRDPARVRRGGSRSPLGYLRSLTTGSGAVRYSRTSAQTPVWVTAQAALALRRRPFPLAALRRARHPAHAAAARARPRAARAARAPARPRTAPTTTAARARRRHTAAPVHAALRATAPPRAGAAAPAGAPAQVAALARSAGIVSALVLAPLTAGTP